MRLIDADALKQIIHEHDYPLANAINSRDYGMFTVGIDQAIDEAPTIDAVEVVRCKDCKHSEPIDDFTEFALPLMCRGTRYGAVMPYWFCEHGERKDGGEEDENNV